MSRIAKLPLDLWDPDLRAMTYADSGTPLEQGLMRMMAHAPEVAKGVTVLGGAFKQSQSLPEKLKELVRLRIAFHNQCRSCMAIRYQSAVADGVSENLVCSLEKPEESPDLNEAEKATLSYADKFANDHLSITESTFDQLRKYFSEAQIVELGMWIAFCVGFGRLGATWDMVEELPESFQDKNRLATPWRETSMLVRG